MSSPDGLFFVRPVTGSAAAVAFGGGGARSWVQVHADGSALAAAMLGAGAERGPVLVACQDRYHLAVALLAAWALERPAVLPPNQRRETLAELAALAGAGLLVHDGLPGGAPADGLALAALDVRAPGVGAAPPAWPLDVGLRLPATRLLATLYTSGSTGRPLACAKTAGQLLGEARLLSRCFGPPPGARLLATVPAQHIYGLLVGVLAPLLAGAAFSRETPLHAPAIARAAADAGVSFLCSAPAQLTALAAGPEQLPGGATLFSSGGPLDRDVAARLGARDLRLIELLGSTETGGFAYRSGADQAWSCLPGVEVAAGPDRRLQLRSPFLPAGAPQPHLGSDLVEPQGEGKFLHLGREDGVVKIGGRRVAVMEVEERLRRIPGVTDAAVLAVAAPAPRGHELWAAVVAPGLDLAVLRAQLRAGLDAVAVPRRFRLLEALPREASGKLTRARLSALFAAPAEASGPARREGGRP